MNNTQMYSFSKKYAGKRLSPLKSIKAYCKSQCCCEELESWKNCTFTTCLPYRYRLGQGNRSKQQKQASGVHKAGNSKAIKQEHGKPSPIHKQPLEVQYNKVSEPVSEPKDRQELLL